MYSFYQSSVRKTIQTEIYKKQSEEIMFCGKKYFAIKKEKKIWPLTLVWIQAMWIDFSEPLNKVKTELTKVKKTYKKIYRNKPNKSCMFFQFWVTTVASRFPNKKHNENMISDILRKRKEIQNSIKNLWLKKSFRENMPPANILYNTKKTPEQLMSEMNKHAKRYLKKAIKSDFVFSELNKCNYSNFYNKRKDTAQQKWFNIISYNLFIKLVNYLNKNNTWKIFIVKEKENIIAGSIFCLENNTITYLYGFSDRKYSNSGAHYYLNFETMKRAHNNQYNIMDMMWWALIGDLNHELSGVSKFKESLGWKKEEYYWSYDLVISPIAYLIFKLYRKILNILK